MATFAPNQSQAIKEIETYSDAVRRNKVVCTEPCDLCGEPCEGFKRHDARPRKFRIIVEQLVVVVICWVMR